MQVDRSCLFGWKLACDGHWWIIWWRAQRIRVLLFVAVCRIDSRVSLNYIVVWVACEKHEQNIYLCSVFFHYTCLTDKQQSTNMPFYAAMIGRLNFQRIYHHFPRLYRNLFYVFINVMLYITLQPLLSLCSVAGHKSSQLYDSIMVEQFRDHLRHGLSFQRSILVDATSIWGGEWIAMIKISTDYFVDSFRVILPLHYPAKQYNERWNCLNSKWLTLGQLWKWRRWMFFFSRVLPCTQRLRQTKYKFFSYKQLNLPNGRIETNTFKKVLELIELKFVSTSIELALQRTQRREMRVSVAISGQRWPIIIEQRHRSVLQKMNTKQKQTKNNNNNEWKNNSTKSNCVLCAHNNNSHSGTRHDPSVVRLASVRTHPCRMQWI